MQDSLKKAEEYLAEFGVSPKEIKEMNLIKVSQSIWLTSKELNPPAFMNVQAQGLRLLRLTKTSFKPTTYGLQFLGKKIKKRVVDLSKEELLMLANGNELKKSAETGFIALRFNGEIIGCGLCRNNLIQSQFPKEFRIALLEILK